MDKDILREIYKPLTLARKPFLKKNGLGRKANDLLPALEYYKKKGIIRRFGAVIDHRRIGLTENAMVCWNIDEKQRNALPAIIGRFPCISHCYFRRAYSSWPYNFYTMIHARTVKERKTIVGRLARALSTREYKVLRTIKEFKKKRSVIDLR